MWNIDYLMATLDQMTKHLEISGERFDEEKGQFECTLKRGPKVLPLTIPATWFTENLTYGWDSIQSRVSMYIGVCAPSLNNDESLEKACCFLFVYRNIFEQMPHQFKLLDNPPFGMRYKLGDNIYIRTVDDFIPGANVVGCHALLEGYSVLDYIGSHIEVVSPNGLMQDVDYGPNVRCHCNEYRETKRCIHDAVGHLYYDQSDRFHRKNLVKHVDDY